jgi:hypothetical protein
LSDTGNTLFPLSVFTGNIAIDEEIHDIIVGELIQRGMEKTSIPRNILKKLVHGALVGDIAPALARNQKLPGGTVVPFENNDIVSQLGSPSGSHKTCSPGADYAYSFTHARIQPPMDCRWDQSWARSA